jgi:hypothetical protein
MVPPTDHRTDANSIAGGHADGGSAALLGYLYQLLGSASVSVSLVEKKSDSTSPDEFIFEVETFGQDAVLTTGQAVQLIQFKYSKGARPISPGELADVLAAFERSERQLRDQRVGESGPGRVDWILKGNRPLSPASEAILGGSMPPDHYRIDSSHIETIRRLNGSHLEIERQIDFAEYEDILRNRARRLGVDGSASAINSALGYLLRKSVEPRGLRRIDRQLLDDELAGYPGARLLSAVDCAPLLREQLVKLAPPQDGVTINEAIRRAKVDRLLYSDDAAIAVVSGPGGSGKTLSVLKALHDVLDDRSIMVGALMPPRGEWRQSVPELVASWRSATRVPIETLNVSIERVLVANIDVQQRPVLVLSLDGLDESSSPQRNNAEALVRYFHDLHQTSTRSGALLIVTCRRFADFKALIEPSGTGGVPGRQVTEVPLGNFDAEEFQVAWRRWFPTEDVPSVDPSADSSLTLASEMTRDGSPNPTGALTHPVLLGCIRWWTPEERADLIAGDVVQWRRLIGQYVDWFVTKVVRRRGESANVVRAVLRAAAIATHEAAPKRVFDMATHWIIPARDQMPEVGRLFLKNVFEDAVTAGLVESEGKFEIPAHSPVPWEWRLPFMSEHFRSLP